MKNLAFFCFFLIFNGLFMACKHDFVVTPEPISPSDTTWQAHPSVRFDNIILKKCFATEKQLFVVGNNYFLTFDTASQLINSQLISKEGIGTWRSNIPYINFNVAVYSEVSYSNTPILTIRSTTNPSIKTTINISEIDTNYAHINRSIATFCAINDKNQLILPIVYRKWNNINRVSYDNYFLIFDLFLGNDSIRYKVNKLIRVPDTRPYVDYEPPIVTGITPYGDNFYFTSRYEKVKTVNIATSRADSLNFPLSFGIFTTIRDTLWAVGLGKDNNLTMSFKPTFATNAAWQSLILTRLWNGWDGFQFANIDDKFIIFYGNQLWHLTLSGDKKTFDIKELSNFNLDKTEILDMVLFNKKVYLATPNGLFFKPLKTFFTYKK